MAPLFRFEVKVHGRSRGRRAEGLSAYRAAKISCPVIQAYRSGTRATCLVNDKVRVFDYTSKRGVVHSEILVPDGAPDWARDRETFYPAVERAETRVDAQLLRELVITLPVNIDIEIVKGMLRAWARRELVAHGMAADLCVHLVGTPLDPSKPEHRKRIEEFRRRGWPMRQLARGQQVPKRPPPGPQMWRLADGRVLIYQPHAHILLTMRKLEPTGFARKKERDWNRKAHVYRWRQSFERDYNALLEAEGFDERVTSKAKWKIIMDAKTEDDIPLELLDIANLHGSKPPVERNLGGAHHAALDGRLTAGPAMDLFNQNKRVRGEKRYRERIQKDHDARFPRALARFRGLMATGDVTFERTPKGSLGYDDPKGLVTRDDRVLWSGFHETLLSVLETTPKPAAVPTADEQLAGTFAQVRQLLAQGVVFTRAESGTLRYDDPNRAMTPEIYKSLSGKHEAILAELDRMRLERERVTAEQRAAEAADLVANKSAEAAAAATEKANLAERLALEQDAHQNLKRGIDALTQAAERDEPVPEASARLPALRRLGVAFGRMSAVVRTRTEEAAAARAERNEMAVERDRALHDWKELENGVSAFVQAAVHDRPIPSKLPRLPALQQLGAAIIGLRGRLAVEEDRTAKAEGIAAEQTVRAERAEKEVVYLREALKRVADWVGGTATKLGRGARTFVQEFLKGGDDIYEGKSPRSVQIKPALSDWPPDARSGSQPPARDEHRPLRATDAMKTPAAAEPRPAVPPAPRQPQIVEDEMGL